MAISSAVPDILNILVLGGTREARALSSKIIAKGPQYRLIYSLSGCTPQPVTIPQVTRIGSFSSVADMASFLRAESIDAVIDATHPFATRISEQAKQACHDAFVAHLILTRKPWQVQPEDHFVVVDSIEKSIPYCIGYRVFLAIGARHIMDFKGVAAELFVVRSKTSMPALPAERFIWLPFNGLNVPSERALLQEYRIQRLICRNSGGAAMYAKITAARELKIKVVLIRQPPLPNAEICNTISDALSWLKKQGA